MALPFRSATAVVLIACAFAGCEKTTTTRTDASGATTTTTTISATPTASAALGKAGDVAIDSATTLKIKSLRIDVDTKDGAVTLSGTVPSAANAERAATLAKGIDGVKSVANRLTVKAPG